MTGTITPDRLSEFVDLVGVVVRDGIRYRHTMDSRLKHSLPPLERDLLARADELAAELRAAAVEVEAGEGGAS